MNRLFSRGSRQPASEQDAGGLPPPSYQRVVTKVYPYSLRYIVSFTAFLGFIWAVAIGVQNIRYMSNTGETTKEKTFDLVSAVLYFVIAAIEGAALFISFRNQLPLGRLISVLAPLGIILVIAAQIIAVLEHFLLKTDLFNQCYDGYINTTYIDSSGLNQTVSSTQATSICNSNWNHDTVNVFAWLIVVSILAFLFGSIGTGYLHQLRNPSSIRGRGQRQEQAIPLQPQSGYQPWMVPPYPGPPPGGSTAPAPGFEKADYQPEAEWANAEYAPPFGPPPPRSAHRAEEDAWERARTEGPTAHLTGQGRAPPRETEDVDDGYVIPNQEEDEAWERARTEGVTAHLTGNRRTRTEGQI